MIEPGFKPRPDSDSTVSFLRILMSQTEDLPHPLPQELASPAGVLIWLSGSGQKLGWSSFFYSCLSLCIVKLKVTLLIKWGKKGVVGGSVAK
jgi:hypothetical protein